jgi:hypothetical protein
MREMNLSYPADRKADILTKDQKLCHEAKIKNDKREKEGKFYVLEGYLPKSMVFVPKGENTKEYIEKYIQRLETRSTQLHKLKI